MMPFLCRKCTDGYNFRKLKERRTNFCIWMTAKYQPKMKKTENPVTNDTNIQPESRDGIWHFQIFHADIEKEEKRYNERI